MIFSEKLQILRKNKGYTQEALADKLGVSRQAVAKWESGQIYPDISNLIQISDLMNVSVDYLVKDQDCAVGIKPQSDTDLDELIAFRLEANVNTYAAFKNEVDAIRPASHDFRYENGKYISRHICRRRGVCRRRSGMEEWTGCLCDELYGTGIGGWL